MIPAPWSILLDFLSLPGRFLKAGGGARQGAAAALDFLSLPGRFLKGRRAKLPSQEKTYEPESIKLDKETVGRQRERVNRHYHKEQPPCHHGRLQRKSLC